ncbi:carotenoid oxygenase [Pseudonocardiaceae bacterium YIM PH 21723]|nr:carotenoid oxygenase [Pseudonocardiaceae bacterium YIM PH 21723]
MDNAFLAGTLAPVAEERTLTDLRVAGTIPDWLDGRYLRNGPNPVSEVDPATYHWFTGDGMVHGVRLRDGKAEWYRNRWVRSQHVSRTLGEEPLPGVGRFGANTNVVQHNGRTLALVEGGAMNYELTDELETIGACDFGFGPGYTAHPHRDPVTGDLHAVSYAFSMGNSVQYSVVGADGLVKRVVDVKVTGSPMMHDFSLTENYVIFYDLPVTFDVREAVPASAPAPMRWAARLVMSAVIGKVRIPDPIAAMAGKAGSNGGLPYRWNPEYPARVGVMPREGEPTVRWFDVEPCYVFHPANAYEQDGEIVLELARFERMFADKQIHGPSGSPTLDRWTIDLAAGKVREQRLDDRPQEFPRIDERLTGRRHRYAYTMAAETVVAESRGLIKHDLDKQDSVIRDFGDGQNGEFVFVPRAADAGEDDGVLMGFVDYPADGRAELRILDAGTLEDIATVALPNRVPAGFHGNWAPTP